MVPNAIDTAPSPLAAAVKGNLYSFFEFIDQSAKATVHRGEYGYRWRTSVAHPWFNGVLSKQPAGPDAAQHIQDTVAYFKENGVANFTWWLAPGLEDGAWASELQAQGLRYDDQTPGMVIDLNALPHQEQSPLTIRRVADRSALADYSRTLMRGFGMMDGMVGEFADLFDSLGLGEDRPLHHFLGFLGGEPVATSALFLSDGTAGIYNVATLPAARGRGVGSAMTLAPLREAQILGYRTGILQSSEMGYHVYRRMGFETVGQIDHYYWSAQ